ncbi:OstA-like protein [Draconibacterium halophilum]|uniref:Organic solvent tolerance protein OstA n=1 Tax=Draconibacterium halophilum TaxID=2706887 RepID=A0A6C0RGU5_9BACT|nr:OstA-like protein [Draconibacterium halophilum]QIA08753.1 organic solvent tolerance protein OstA [Draconibacterium halophilum]
MRNLIPTILFFALSLASVTGFSQEKKRVEIIQAESLEQSDNISNAQRLINNVIIRHEGVMMYCDSAYTYQGTNRVDAFGNVHINEGDTLHLYARKVYYDGDRSFAQAIDNVKLVNTEMTLYTDTLDYDMNLNVGYYDCFGKIVDSTNTLTSKEGKYFLDDNEAHFTDSVVGYSDKYTIDSEDLRYNTQTEVIYFKGPTTIRDSVNTLYAEDGWYNTQTGEADLNLHPMVYNDTQSIQARQISYNQENGDGYAEGNVTIEDFENQSIIKGNKVTYNEEKETAIATDSAVFISYNETDSLFLHADTLKSIPDTIDGENLVMAYYGVRFFRNDVQGICDSLMYFTKDSLVQLHRNPVIWSEQHQLSADYIEMIQHTNAPNEMHLTKNSFIISKQDTGRYDQIKGKDMLGYIINGKLNNIDVDGNGQTLYYARDKEAVIGLNRAESSNISIRFKDGKIHAIAFQKQPEGQLKPILNLEESEKTLPGFEWKIKLRPLSKDDIFWRPEKKEVVEEEELTGQ